MKNMKNKTTKNNMINYGIVIAFCDRTDPFLNWKPFQTSYGTSCSALCLYHCVSFPEPGSRFFR